MAHQLNNNRPSPKKLRGNRSYTPKEYDGLDDCRKLLKELRTHKRHFEYTQFFLEPVDVNHFRIFDYFDIIKKPMDLHTIHDKFEDNLYKNEDEFAEDVRLIFNNCYQYNGRDHMIGEFCRKFEEVFEKKFAVIKKKKGREKVEPLQQSPHQPPVDDEATKFFNALGLMSKQQKLETQKPKPPKPIAKRINRRMTIADIPQNVPKPSQCTSVLLEAPRIGFKITLPMAKAKSMTAVSMYWKCTECDQVYQSAYKKRHIGTWKHKENVKKNKNKN